MTENLEPNTPTMGNEQSPAPDTPPDWDEQLYQSTVRLLIEQPDVTSPWWSAGCLLVSLVLFALSFWGLGWDGLAFLIPVLFLHEAGHWLGMRWFGYRNLQMFFVPFFGAAVSGKKHAAPAWQQVVVLLLGPLPGIILGLGLLLAFAPDTESWVFKLILWLLILNGLNLLPVVPLDGGRIVDVLLFARRPWLAVAFRLLAVVALASMAWQHSSVVFGLVAVAMLLGTHMRYQRARLERAFANNPAGLHEDIEQLDDPHKRELFGWVRLLSYGNSNPVSLASEMRELHEHMVTRRPGVVVWLLLMALYVGGIAATFAAYPIANRQETTRIEARRQEDINRLIAAYDEYAARSIEIRRQMKEADEAKKAELLLAETQAESQAVAEWLTRTNAWARAFLALSRRVPDDTAEQQTHPLRLARFQIALNNALVREAQRKKKEKETE